MSSWYYPQGGEPNADAKLYVFFETGKKERDIFGVICIILWINVNRTAMILCQRGGLFIILDHYAKVHGNVYRTVIMKKKGKRRGACLLVELSLPMVLGIFPRPYFMNIYNRVGGKH